MFVQTQVKCGKRFGDFYVLDYWFWNPSDQEDIKETTTSDSPAD